MNVALGITVNPGGNFGNQDGHTPRLTRLFSPHAMTWPFGFWCMELDIVVQYLAPLGQAVKKTNHVRAVQRTLWLRRNGEFQVCL